MGNELGKVTGSGTQCVGVSAAAHHQSGGTCYANAIATAIRATESRIVGRKPESHSVIKDRIIKKYGRNGANTWNVLQAECTKRQLKCQKVSEEQAMRVVCKNRVVVCRFRLDDAQWARFSAFFKSHPDGTLTASALGKAKASTSGHAVCVIGYNPSKDHWKIKNSWGAKFADNGYFRVKRDAFPSAEFIDVYYRVCDLTQTDLNNYNRIMNKN